MFQKRTASCAIRVAHRTTRNCATRPTAKPESNALENGARPFLTSQSSPPKVRKQTQCSNVKPRLITSSQSTTGDFLMRAKGSGKPSNRTTTRQSNYPSLRGCPQRLNLTLDANNLTEVRCIELELQEFPHGGIRKASTCFCNRPLCNAGLRPPTSSLIYFFVPVILFASWINF